MCFLNTSILAANVPNNIGRNSPFRSFASFLIVLLILVINNPDSLSDLTTFVMPFIFSFEIINAVVPDS